MPDSGADLMPRGPVVVAAGAAGAADARRHLPGEEGIWFFVFGDMMVFALFFCVFTYYRGDNVELFNASQAKLNQLFGLFNTVLMLTSSWCVASAVKAARSEALARFTPRLLAAGWLCGAGFVAVKVLEYGEKIRAGVTLTSNDFFMYYFMFTGIHLVHVLLGLVVLGVLVRYTAGASHSPTLQRNLESGATFWHLVDLLWIVLFSLLYLVK